MKKNVLIILNGLGMGGAQNMIYEMLNFINRDVFDINVLCYGSRIDNLLTEKIEKIQNVKYLGLSGRITLFSFIKIVQEIDRIKPDIVHAHLGGIVFAVPWGLLRHKPVIVTAHTKPEKAFSKKIVPFLRNGIKKDIVQLVTVSKENQNLMVQYFNLNEHECAFINNGININRYYRKKHEQFTFINVGRQDENKNQIAILKSFARLYAEYSNIMLYLVGDGDEHQTLIDSAKSLNIYDHVIFTGNVGNTEDYYALSDCYVQSSHREALPLTVLEAMATGLPVISTDVGGMKDVVSNRNGFLIEDGDDEALFMTMKNIYEMPREECILLEEASLEIVGEYSAEQMTRKYEQLYLTRDEK